MPSLGVLWSELSDAWMGTSRYGFVREPGDLVYPVDMDFYRDNKIGAGSLLDDAGNPAVRQEGDRFVYLPSRVATQGLTSWNEHQRRGSGSALESFRRSAQWFRENQDDGRWWHHLVVGDLPVPWISSLAQGIGISVLVRAWSLDGDPEDLRRCEKAIEPLRIDIADGGVRSTLAGGDPFLEEYPGLRSTPHVLNGFLFPIIGLFEFSDVQPGHRVLDEVSELVRSLERNIGIWDLGNWSTYDAYNAFGRGSRNACTVSYHSLQTVQLTWLAHRTGSPRLAEVAGRWGELLQSRRARLSGATKKIQHRSRVSV